MKKQLFEKNKFIEDGKHVTEYKFCNIVLVQKEKSFTKKRWKICGITFCIRRHKKISYRFSVMQKIKHYLKKEEGLRKYQKSVKKHQNARILVVLHLFYMSSWRAIQYYLQNLEPYQYTLIVTYVEGFYRPKVLAKIKKFHPNTVFYKYENKGFDIGSFVDVLTKVDLNDYDIVFKLQSKGIYRPFIFIYNQIFKYKDWFHNLFQGILGENSVHKTIKILMEKKQVGLVAAKNLLVSDPKHKNYFTQQVAQKLHIEIPQNYTYVAGSCFAIKASLLQKIKELNLRIDDFEKSQRGKFSLAHALERIICAAVEAQGYDFHGIVTEHNLYENELRCYRKKSALRLLKDKRFELDYEFFYKTLESKLIDRYEVVQIKLKDIRRKWLENVYSLQEVSPYAYLCGDKKRYQQYCVKNSECSQYNMSVERFDDLIESIESNGFNAKKMPVVWGENNIIIDGQHRCCYLLNKYGQDYMVSALRLYT